MNAIGLDIVSNKELKSCLDPYDSFEPLGDPQPGDWLASYYEHPQSFQRFINLDMHKT